MPGRGVDHTRSLVNESGAELRKSGGGSSSISWDLTNSGSIVVEDGDLRIFGAFSSNGGTIDVLSGSMELGDAFSGSSQVTIQPGAVFEITGEPSPSASFDLSGDIELAGIGSSNDSGTLSLSGSYRVLSDSNFTQNYGEFINSGQAVFSTNKQFRDADTEVTVWRNTPGSTLDLEGSSRFTTGSADPDGSLVNESGAELRKSGGGSSSISWDLTNSGSIVVEDGDLRIFGAFSSNGGTIDVLSGSMQLGDAFSGSSQVTIQPGAVFEITGEPSPSANFDLSGDIELSGVGSSNESGTLSLSGSYRVLNDSTSTRNYGEFINSGQAVFSTNERLVDAGTEVTVWRNTPGASLDLEGSSGFSNASGTGLAGSLVNESGAELRKSGGSTSSINWDLTNSGSIVVEDGDLRIDGEFSLNEGVLDIAQGTLTITASDPYLKSLTSTITGAGTLDFTTAPALFNRGTLNPTPTDLETNPDGLTIDVPFIQNDDTAVFRTQIGSLAGRLTCTGVYDVGGTIDIQRLGEFEFDGDETFTVIEANFVTGVFPDYFANAVPDAGSNTAFGVRTGDLRYDLTYSATSVVISNVSVIVPPCNPADIAEPSGLLDLADINSFVNAFGLGDELADLAEPFGLLDLGDINSFVQSFLVGCP